MRAPSPRAGVQELMVEREIDSTGWRDFGEAFSAVHHGWLTEATRREPSGVEHRLWEDAALDQVALHTRGATAVGDELVVTAVTPDARRGRGARLRAVADDPRRVAVLETEDGRHAGLVIQEADGTTTELRFHARAFPEQLDGLLEEIATEPSRA